MSGFLSWLFVIAYFSVFFLGLYMCFYLAAKYFKKRSFLQTVSTFILALCAVAGLLQAIVGV